MKEAHVILNEMRVSDWNLTDDRHKTSKRQGIVEWQELERGDEVLPTLAELLVKDINNTTLNNGTRRHLLNIYLYLVDRYDVPVDEFPVRKETIDYCYASDSDAPESFEGTVIYLLGLYQAGKWDSRKAWVDTEHHGPNWFIVYDLLLRNNADELRKSPAWECIASNIRGGLFEEIFEFYRPDDDFTLEVADR